MIAVHIEDAYLEAIEKASLPPEIRTRQSKVNYLIRLGLDSMVPQNPNLTPSAVAGEQSSGAEVAQDHNDAQSVTGSQARNEPQSDS